MIRRYGDAAVLRQPGMADRACSFMWARVTPEERQGQASNPMDRKVIISAISPETDDLLTPIPSERDALVTSKELLKIYAPPDSAGPNDDALYWRLFVRA